MMCVINKWFTLIDKIVPDLLKLPRKACSMIYNITSHIKIRSVTIEENPY